MKCSSTGSSYRRTDVTPKSVEGYETVDRFVDGYGYVWVNAAGNLELIEYVIAFAGGGGANSWLKYAKTYDQHETTFRHEDSISGIGNHFGEHYVYPSRDVGDYFLFVKG